MQDCKPCVIPMNLGVSLIDEGDSFSDLSLYRTIIGSVQYLTYAWPDTAFVVKKLNWFLSSPKLQHWLACKQSLLYLKGTIGLGLLFAPTSRDLSLIVYTNANHVGCKVTRRSTSGLCVFLGQNLLVWSSWKQGITEILWLKSLFSEIGYPCGHVPILWCDNLASKNIAENLVFHSRTKHIEIDVHFVHEKIENGEIEIRYVPHFIRLLIFLPRVCQGIDFLSCVISWD